MFYHDLLCNHRWPIPMMRNIKMHIKRKYFQLGFQLQWALQGTVAMGLEKVFFSKGLAGAFLQGIVVGWGGVPTWFQVCRHIKQGFFFQEVWCSYQLPQSPGLLEWSRHPSEPYVALSWLTGSLSPPTCSCGSGWAGPCWDMEPGLGNWPARLRKLVRVSRGLFPHHLLREITATLRTLRSSQRLASLQNPEFESKQDKSRHHMWHQYGQGAVKTEATQIIYFLSICTLAYFLGCWCL